MPPIQSVFGIIKKTFTLKFRLGCHLHCLQRNLHKNAFTHSVYACVSALYCILRVLTMFWPIKLSFSKMYLIAVIACVNRKWQLDLKNSFHKERQNFPKRTCSIPMSSYFPGFYLFLKCN